MKFRKILLCLLAALTLTACQNQETEQPRESEAVEDLEPVQEYVLNADSKWFLGKPTYEQVLEDIKSGNYIPLETPNEYYTEAVIEGNIIHLKVTEKQKEKLLANNEKLARDAEAVFKQLSEKNSVEWNEDFSKVTYHIDYEKILTDSMVKSAVNMEDVVMINVIMYINRKLTTGVSGDVIDTTVINAESGYVLANALMPYEPISISYEDYELSKTQDVAESWVYNGYTEIKMEVKAVDEQKIIFTPLERDKLYTEDESLCLCLDSVYAQDVTVPSDLKEGDIVLLRLDGTYAMHNDGDDIPDIAPLTMVPLKYREAHQN